MPGKGDDSAGARESGESIGAGRESLASHGLLASEKKTLTDADAQKFLKRFERLVVDVGGELRRG